MRQRKASKVLLLLTKPKMLIIMALWNLSGDEIKICGKEVLF